MVAIVAGKGFGLLDTSLNTIGAAGVAGNGLLGQGSSRAMLNVANGNLVLQAQDGQLAGCGTDLLALRTYNSLTAMTAGDGDGWRWSFDQTVRFQGPGAPAQAAAGATVIRTDDDGHETTYTADPVRAVYVATEGAGAYDELRYNSAAAEWVWTDGTTRVTERYSNSTGSGMMGRLLRRTDPSGNDIALVYDAGRLTAIRDSSSQQELRLTYGAFNGFTRVQQLEARSLMDDANGHATPALGDPVRLAEYDYDGYGRLTAVTRYLAPVAGNLPPGPGFVTNYSYDGSSHRITTVTDSDGTTASFTYDAAGRVSTVRDHLGAPGAQLDVAYGAQPDATAVTNGNGLVSTYRYDPTSGQLLEVVAPAVGGTPPATSFAYDPAGNLTSIADANHNTVTFGYDGAGNRTRERDAVGNTTTRTFSSSNQVLTQTRYRIADPDGGGPQGAGVPATTRYVYDANARLRFVVSPEGRVTESRYGGPNAGFGLLTVTILYVGQLFDVTTMGPTQQLTETDLTDWVAALPDRTQIQLTEYRYDLRGNVNQQTSYATVSTAGAGVLDAHAGVTEYVRDAYSLLRDQIAVRGGARDRRAIVASFEYDGMTREVQSRGANGLRTTSYDDANRRVTVTNASGLTEVREYDSRHRLMRISQLGDGTTRETRFVYDSADQLRMVEDAQGGRRYRFYDAAGRLTFTVDAIGAVTGFEHDAAGQLTRQTQYANPASTAEWYDAVTDTVTQSELTVGNAGSDVVVDATRDRATTYAYDEAGRLTVSTDGANTATVVTYDGLSRVVMTQTGDRVTRYLYDKDSRRVGVVDALGYLTEHKYDAGGRLIETIRYSLRSPAAPNMSAPVWIGVTEQHLVGGRPFAYRVPAFDANGNALAVSVVGAAPAWLTFDAVTATLRGTPPGGPTTDSIMLRAADGFGRTSEVTERFVVSNDSAAGGAQGAGPAWDSLPPLDVAASVPVHYVVPPAAGSPAYAVLGGMPPGLTFDAPTLTITGSSSAAGFYSILLRATDPNGDSTDRTLSVRIRAIDPGILQQFGSDQMSAWRPADTGALHSYFFYDGQGRVVGAVDEQQGLTESVYDEEANTLQTLRYLVPVSAVPGDDLASVRNRAGAPFQLSFVSYEDFGRVLEATGLDGSATRNGYDEAGRLVRVVSAAGTSEERIRTTFYNAFGETRATLGGEGSAWLGANPSPQRIEEVIRDYGIQYDYDTLGRMVRSVDASGNTTLCYYDREYRHTHTVNVVGDGADHSLSGEVSETAYTSFGQPATTRRYAGRLAETDMNQLLADGGGLAGPLLLGKLAVLADAAVDQVSSFEYDRCGRLVRQVDGENGVLENAYNAHGELAAQTRSTRNGETTTKQFDYDLNGRLLSQTEDVGAINASTATDYGAFGRVVLTVDASGRAISTTYQDSGRSVIVTDALQQTRRTDYDVLGRVIRQTNPLGYQTRYAYDDSARTVTVTSPEGRQVTTLRGRHGETRSVTDARGNVVRYEYNKDGQPTSVTDALGRIVAQTTYDTSGRRLEIADARGIVTRFRYDRRNRVVEQRVDPNGLNLTTRFEFDAFGQQIVMTDAAGTAGERLTRFEYDRKGRSTKFVVDAVPGGLELTTTYRYDGLDHTVAIARGTVSGPNQHVILYEFDNLGRRLKEIAAPGSRNRETQYRYDANSRLTRRIDPNGHSAWYVYDAAGRLTQTVGALGDVTENRYDAAGRVMYTHSYLDRLSPATVAGFGDVIDTLAVPAATPNDGRSHVVYDADGQTRCILHSAGPSGWTIGETRYDPNGNAVEVRSYDKFLPDAPVAALDSAASLGITLAEIQNELDITLGYRDDDPDTLANVPRTFLVYDATNRLRFTVDPTDAVVENVTDAAGNRMALVCYAGRPTLTQYTESTIDAAVDRAHPGNRVTRYAYDAATRLRYTVDALNSVTENAYDARGNVVKTTLWAARPALTQYTEAAIATALIGQQDADVDQVTHFVNDAGNRLRFAIDASGGVVEHVYDAVSNLVATTRFARRPTPAPGSFIETDLVAAVAPLRGDLDNQVTRFAYDPARRLRFSVDALGSVTESVSDPNGNLIATIRFAMRPALPEYDEAAIAAAVAPLSADPANRVSRLVYDAMNRLRFSVDALGGVSERVYDALGRVILAQRFTARPGLLQYTEAAIDAAVAPLRGQAGNRVEHRLYDALGRMRFNALRVSLDGGQAQYSVTEQELNALGQSISSTSYAAAVTPGSITEAVIAAAVGDGDAFRDRTSRYLYDLAGRQIYRLDAVSVEADRRTYRVVAQRFDALGQAVGSISYATPIAVDSIDNAAVDAAVQTIADGARDRASAVIFDLLGQPLYTLRVLGDESYQVGRQEFDTLGRLFRTTQYVTAVGPLADFDPATVEAAVSAVAGPADRQVQYVYDVAGRQRFVLQADRAGYWTVGESRYDIVGNVVETRRYDRFATDAWIASMNAVRPAGAREQDVISQLTALGYNDATPATLSGIQRTRFAYDRQNRVRFTIDARGGAAENVYDALGDLRTTGRYATRPAPAEFSEGAIDAAVDRTDAGNRVQHSVYDALGQCRFDVQVFEANTGTNGKHGITERRYDALGQLVDTRAYATTVGHLDAYDEHTLAAAVVADAASDRHAVVVYDEGGRQIYGLRAIRVGLEDRYVVIRQVHDALGQLIQRIDYASPAAVTQFDAAAVQTAVVPDGFNDRSMTYVHDAAGRMRFEIRPDLSCRERVYDALDQLVEARQFEFTLPSHDGGTEAEMSALRGGRVVGDGITRGQAHGYDAAGRRLRTSDAAGRTEQYEYDALGGRLRWFDKNGQVWRCAYDRLGRRRVEVTPPIAFTLLGEDVTAPAPNRVIETHFVYDAFNNLVRKTEAANFASDAAVTDILYDTLGRPIGTLSPGYYDAATGTVEQEPGVGRFRPEASISYDTLGNTVRTGTRRTADAFDYTYRTYDARGQVVHEVSALNHVTRHTCNAFGERETITRHSVTITGTPQNGIYWVAGELEPQLNLGVDELGDVLEDVYARTIHLAYDTLGRKSGVTLPTATFYSTQMPGDTSQANYYRLSPDVVTGVQDAGATRYEYNAFGDLTRQRVRANTIVEWQDTSFTCDVMGRRIGSLDAAGNPTTLSYDMAGNLVFQNEATDQPGTDRRTQFVYNVVDQQIRVDRYRLRYTDGSGEHGVVAWTWVNGGTLLDPDADVATTVQTTTYDPYGRPLTVTDAAGNLVTMRYDALGHLIEIVGPARTVAPIGSNGEETVDPFRNQIREMLVTSMTLDVFGRPVRQVRATSLVQDTRELRQAYDAAGNLVSTTDAEGNVKRRACDVAGRVIKETQEIHADLGPLGINEQGIERRYVYDALGQLTDTLDVYIDGTDLVQSGKSVLYNTFGEATEERRKWGPANQSVDMLNMARSAWYHYDNAGHVFETVAADRLTLYYYNLLGQVTREEKRGNSNPTDGTGHRTTEYQYDVLSRATMVRRPVFNADVTPGTGTTVRPVTPYLLRRLDRWGNVGSTEEGGYELINGQPSFPQFRIFGSYQYDSNDRQVGENLGTHGYTGSDGVSTNAVISKRTFRDLLGNAVKEVDEASEPQTDAVLSSRTRRKEYDEAGRVTAEIDGTRKRIEYAYNIHGDRLGTRNARGTVLFNRCDRNGSVRFHGVLRTSSPTGAGEYDSHTGTGTIVRTYLNAYLYDEAGRRVASKTFTEEANAPWAYTWLDGRNLGVRQCDVMGVVTERRFDPFGNKSVEIDGAGVRSEWNAATTDYVVGRIETYRQPVETGTRFGQYTYNDFGEINVHAVGNTMTAFDRHANGLVSDVTITPDVTHGNVREWTGYQYDVRGQLTMEGRFDSNSVQTKMISYDVNGRLARVEQGKAPGGVTCDVTYAYDEWSNVRRVRASYTHTGFDGPFVTESWYDFDAAGRMTISNGTLSNGTSQLKTSTPGSVRISYDSVGRRRDIAEYVRHNTTSHPLRSWDTMRDEQYEYDDLGHLRQVQQRIRQVNFVQVDPNGGDDHPAQHDQIGPWQMLSTRSPNLRGDVLRSQQWARIAGLPNNPQVPALQGTTLSSYRADGQVTWTQTDAADPKNSTKTQYTYNSPTGRLESYVFNAFRSDGVPFTATFEYSYAFENGARAVRSIRDLHNGLDTFKTYDLMGRLASERVELQKPNGDGSDRYEQRSYGYGADGRIIFKDAPLRLSENGPNTVPLPTPTDGQQTYVYAGNRLAGTIGTLRLEGATKFDLAYTPMSEVGGSGTTRYIVQNGDTLIDIALASYGDGALWYVVADANGITSNPAEPLPTTEVGKAYDIPDVIRSSHAADTYMPFGIGDVVGNDRPIAIPPPPPPRHSDIELMAVAAVSTAIQIGATVVLTELGVPATIAYGIGSGLSNLGGQTTSWALGMQAPGQDGIDWGGVGVAATEGLVFSAAGAASAPAFAFTRELWQQAKTGSWKSASGLNWTSIAGSMFAVGFDALGPVLGGPSGGGFNFSLAGLINGAYNPSTGWAIPGSGRSPVVGAFEFAYSGVANGLVNLAYNWIRERLAQPSAPPAPPAAPAAPAARSVDNLGPMDPKQLAKWDALDHAQVEREDQEAIAAENARIAAENARIAAASNERVGWLLQSGAMDDRIAHFGEDLNDRALIAAAKRQMNFERIERERAAAEAWRQARLRASARIDEQIRAPKVDPVLVEWAENDALVDALVLQDMYRSGFNVYVSRATSIDGLVLNRSGGMVETIGPLSMPGIGVGDGLRSILQMNSRALESEEYVTPQEIVEWHDLNTPAAQARRTGFDTNIQTFSEFSRTYVFTHKTRDGVEQAFLDYHNQKSQEVLESGRRIDNAAGAVNLIARGTVLGMQFIVDPVGAVAPLVLEYGTKKVLITVGVDADTAAMVGQLAGTAFSIGRGARIDPVGTAVSLVAGDTTTLVLKAAGVNDQDASLLGGAAGSAVGLGRMLAATRRSPVQEILHAQRMARAETDAVSLEAAGRDFEMSKGLRISDDVTLFRSVPSAAAAASPASVGPNPAALPSTQRALLPAPAMPASGGMPPQAGVDYYAPGVSFAVPYEATPVRRFDDRLFSGNFAPRSGLVGYMSDGGSGFPGGKSPGGLVVPPSLVLPKPGQLVLPAGRARGNIISPASSGDPIPILSGRLGLERFERPFRRLVQPYVDAVLSNRPWTWERIGLGWLDGQEREVVRMRAAEVGLIPTIPVDPASHADFTSVLIEERELPPDLWLSSDAEQFRYLDRLIGGNVPGTTWHHHELPGWAQLLPFGIHNITSHLGGRSDGGWANAPR